MPNIENVNSSNLEGPSEAVETGAQAYGTAAYHTERIYTQLGSDFTRVVGDIGDAYIKQRTAQEELTQQKIDAVNAASNRQFWNQALDKEAAAPTGTNDLWRDSGMADRLSQQYAAGLASHSTVEGRQQFQARFTEAADRFYGEAQDNQNTLAVVQMAQDYDQTNKASIALATQGGVTQTPEALRQIEAARQTILGSGRANLAQIEQINKTAEAARGSAYAAGLRTTLQAKANELAQTLSDNPAAVEAGVKSDLEGYLAGDPDAKKYLGGRETLTGEDWATSVAQAATRQAIDNFHAQHAAGLQQLELDRNSWLSNWDVGAHNPDGSINTDPARLQALNQAATGPWGQLPSSAAEFNTRRDVYMKAVQDRTNNVAQTDNVGVRGQLLRSISTIDLPAIDTAYTSGQITEKTHGALADEWHALHEHPGWNEAFKPVEAAAGPYGEAMVQGTGPTIGTNGLGVGGHGDPSGERNRGDFHARLWNQFSALAAQEGPDKASTDMLDSRNAYYVGRIAATYAGARGKGVTGAAVAIGNQKTFGTPYNAVPSPETAAKFKKFNGGQ